MTLTFRLGKLGSVVVLTGHLLVLQEADQRSRQRQLLQTFTADQLLDPQSAEMQQRPRRSCRNPQKPVTPVVCWRSSGLIAAHWLTCFVLNNAPVAVAVQVFHQSGAHGHMTNVVQQ